MISFTCRLTGEQLQEDDRLRHEVGKVKTSSSLNIDQVDRLAQDFSLASKEESVEAIGIGEQMLELMNRLGFSPSVTWPGYLRLSELLLKVRPPTKFLKGQYMTRLAMFPKHRSLRRCPMAWSAWPRARRAWMPPGWPT